MSVFDWSSHERILVKESQDLERKGITLKVLTVIWFMIILLIEL